MKANLIENKSFEFAVRIVNLCKYLRYDTNGNMQNNKRDDQYK